MNYSCKTLILGSGISGMTLALLFSRVDSHVLLLEQAPVPGGAMQRFYRKGIGWDTGFHFTGGISDSFGDMLKILELDEAVKTIPIRQKVYFSDRNTNFDLPAGLPILEEYLCEKFPNDTTGIRAYFEAERKVFAKTPLFHLKAADAFTDELQDLEEDHISLQTFLDRHNIHGELYGLLCGLCSCHGTPPDEISFANHARIHYGLSHDPVRLCGGGQSFVNAFLQKAKEKNITLLCGNTVAQWEEADEKNHIKSAVLSNGDTVEFERLIFTGHPKCILSMLPQEKVRTSFRDRVETLEDSCGFFTWYATLDDDAAPFAEGLYSVLSSPDLNTILNGSDTAERSTGFMVSNEIGSDGKKHRCITAFQTEFAHETAQWADTCPMHRPREYCQYKEQKADSLEKLLTTTLFPAWQGKIHTVNTASMLTFRDYLSSSGSAYGVKQKMDQDNLFGRLPVRNFYTASQSSILPGAVGSMLTSLILFRKLAGEEAYRELLAQKLGNHSL